MKIQECVFDKIEDAYNEFKEEMLKKDPEEIFEKAYKYLSLRKSLIYFSIPTSSHRMRLKSYLNSRGIFLNRSMMNG